MKRTLPAILFGLSLQVAAFGQSKPVSGTTTDSMAVWAKNRTKVFLYTDVDRRSQTYTRNLNLYRTTDSTLVVTPNKKWFHPGVTPTEELKVEHIAGIKNRKRGSVLTGVLIGAGFGIVSGVIIGYSTYEPCTSNELLGCFLEPASKEDNAILNGVSMGLTGMLVGAIIGSAKKVIELKGNKDRYAASREKIKRWTITGQ